MGGPFFEQAKTFKQDPTNRADIDFFVALREKEYVEAGRDPPGNKVAKIRFIHAL